jgi:MFS family permease
MPESAPPRPGALASLRPQFRLPARVREPLLLATPVLIAAWALAGFYASLGPTLIRKLAGSSSVALGGLALFVLAGSGALTVLLTREWPARRVMIAGTAALVSGVGITLLSVASGSITGFFVGTAVAGSGFGSGFQGAIRSVLPLSLTHERAGVLSILYVISYLAFGLPAVLGGVRVVHAGVFTTAREYGAAVMAFAALALAGTVLRRPSEALPEPSERPSVRGQVSAPLSR